jgi:hypothetical protein
LNIETLLQEYGAAKPDQIFFRMVEVFKTNVIDAGHASMLVEQIHQSFIDYKANFDLEDCDKILRVKSFSGSVQPFLLINLLKELGFDAEVLPDDFPLS